LSDQIIPLRATPCRRPHSARPSPAGSSPYRHAANNSVVSDAGSQGSITRWDPFGSVRPGSSVATGIGYAGEWRDPSGLIDLRARAYDPAIGRFTAPESMSGSDVAADIVENPLNVELLPEARERVTEHAALDRPAH
jgi:RHS repeat-associated protein